MPAFCPKCGDAVEDGNCPKCGAEAVSTASKTWKDPIKTANGGTGEGYIPSAFVAAARLGQSMGTTPSVPAPPPREKATALFDFVPQDPETQLPLTKGEALEVIRKDTDGWWFIAKDGERGLVPGSYVRIDKPIISELDPAILAAREASNQRFQQWRQDSTRTPSTSDAEKAQVQYDSPLGLKGPADGNKDSAEADARAHDTLDNKPKVVRRLKKCFACNETILGRTKMAKNEIFHEICLICRGCRETIEENDEFTIIKKKAYHADCANEVSHCHVCDKEILGRVYKIGGAPFHKLCMECSLCHKQADEDGSILENDVIVCSSCLAERKRKEEEALAAQRAAEEARRREEEARRLEEEARRREEEAKRRQEEACRKEVEARAAAKAAEEAKRKEEEAKAAEAARLKEEEEKAAAKAAAEARQREKEAEAASEESLRAEMELADRRRETRKFSTASLDQFDLGADFNNTDQRLSEVVDMSVVNERMSLTSDLSGISEQEDTNGDARKDRPQALEEEATDGEEERELCGGCGEVLEGEAIGALNRYFHTQCFKCAHCQRVIAEDDGYAEKDNQAYHQQCYQARFGKRCSRCNQMLKGKVVKALDMLYHPDCFVCYQCKASLTESFFEHDGQAVCAKCKHYAITATNVNVAKDLKAISIGTVGYHFKAQDSTQLTITPGQQVSILQKDEDGWWFVDLNGRRGYVPGSYLIELPAAPTRGHSRSQGSSRSSRSNETEVVRAPMKDVPGLCSECKTQNPDVARFCRKCGNQLIA